MSSANTDRRKVISAGIGAGALVAGAGLMAAPSRAQASGGGAWTPAMEAKDAWMDIPGTRHRIAWDTVSAEGFGEALFFARNFYQANQSGYGLGPEALGVIVIARHFSTPFAYTDAAWAKYGTAFAKVMALEGKQAERAATANPMLADFGDIGMDGQPVPTVSSLGAKGTRFAVCGMATTFIAGVLAKGGAESAKDIEAFLAANLVPGATMVPAGVVAINRTQEHGYAFAYTG